MDTLTLPLDLWGKLVTHGMSILKSYDEFCSTLYATCSKINASHTYPEEAAFTKEEAFLRSLGNESAVFTLYMKRLKDTLEPSSVSEEDEDKTDEDKTSVKIHRWQFRYYMAVCNQLAEAAQRMALETSSVFEGWMSNCGATNITEEGMENLERGRAVTERFVKKLVFELKFLCDEVDLKTANCSPEMGEICKAFEKFRDTSLGDNYFLAPNGFNMLGIAFIEEGNLKDTIVEIISDDAQFDAILHTIRDYLGEEVLNLQMSRIPEELKIPSASLESELDLLADLLCSPSLFEDRLMNLDRIFPPIGKSETFRNLAKVFLAEFAAQMLKSRYNLGFVWPDDMEPDCLSVKLNQYEEVALKYNEVTPSMRTSYEKRMKEAEEMYHVLLTTLNLVLVTLHYPNNKDLRDAAKLYLLGFVSEAKYVIERRNAVSPK